MYWLQKYPLIVLRSTLGCSILLVCSFAFGGPYSDLQLKIRQAGSDADVIRALKSSPSIAGQDDFKQAIQEQKDGDVTDKKLAENVKSMVDLGALTEANGTNATTDQHEAEAIKKSPLYQDPGIDQKRNWLADALNRLKNLRRKKEEQKRNIGGFSLFGPWLSFVMWGIIILAICALLFFAIMHINWQKSLTRKAKALLEEDEPDRTLDEWLQLADQHSAAGRYREAVRALYLACLMKFDESDVARFNRGETNWEHLARVESSPKLPAGLDFRTPTQRFDRIWYGYQTEGLTDVALFREWYQSISEAVKGRPR